jgi:hypothetical protein
MQPRAAGVSQPWFRKRACSGKTTIVAQGRPAGRPYTNAVAVALPHPRRADGRHSSVVCRRSPNDARFLQYSVGITSHGGLTPAALVNVRSHIAKIVISSSIVISSAIERRATRSGGRKPPVENITPLQIAIAHQRRCACMQPGAAGVSQPWFRKRACSGNTTIVAQGRRPYTNAVAVAFRADGTLRSVRRTMLQYSVGITPRRANARRSCERAFAYRKNRHFLGDRTPCNQERLA